MFSVTTYALLSRQSTVHMQSAACKGRVCMITISRGLKMHTQRAVTQEGGFWSYVAGTAHLMALEHDVGGVHIDNHRSTLPARKGLSSSAAACVLVRRPGQACCLQCSRTELVRACSHAAL